jgi:hypothetical protein
MTSVHVVFFLACFLSFQIQSFKQDAIWTLLFALSSVTHFSVAEHRNCQLKLSTIMNIAYYLDSFLDILMIFGFLVSVNWTNLFFIFVLSVCIRKIPQRYSQCVVLFIFLNGIHWYTFLVIFRFALQYKTRQYLNKSVTQCHATIYLKKSVACKAINVLLESVLLWVLRCESRFPHKMRYTPPIIATISIVFSAVYCQYFILDTKVSVKSSIKSIDINHPLTPSLNAILRCEQCMKCLTNVDIEDSVKDNVYRFDKEHLI